MMFKKKHSKNDLDAEYQCTIRFLDDSDPIQISFKKDTIGQWLIDQVCQKLNLVEKDYFGLRYVDMEKQRHWLDSMKTVYKQLKGLNPMVLCFRVKFYPADPMTLHEEITRYYMFLQLRRDLHHGRLLCSPSDANLLAAYIIQSELGDYDEVDHLPGYISDFKMLPKQSPKMEEQIMELHKTLPKQVPSEAETNFLKKAALLDTYGVDPHQVKDQKGSQLYLGVTHQGIMTFQGNRRTQLFKWNQIKRIVYESKMFIVHVNISEEENLMKDQQLILKKGRRKAASVQRKQQPVGYKCPTNNACKYLWRCAVEQQFFFTLSSSTNAPKVRSGSSFFTRGSKFRFSGRCQTEATAASGTISRPEPNFNRSSSLPNFARKTEKTGLRNITLPHEYVIKEELPVDVPGQLRAGVVTPEAPEEKVREKKAPLAQQEDFLEEESRKKTAELEEEAGRNVVKVEEEIVAVESKSESVLFEDKVGAAKNRLSLDMQIKNLEKEWEQRTENNIVSPSDGESGSQPVEDTSPTLPKTPVKAKAVPSGSCRQAFAVTSLFAMFLIAATILLLMSNIQHPIVASIRRQLNLEPVSDYINDKVGSLFRS